MEKKTTGGNGPSRVGWEDLEQWVREQVQQLIQGILEEEVTEFVGRAKSARRAPLGESPGYRNGYGEPRSLTLGAGTIQVRRPRVRNVDERFTSRVLPLFQHRTPQVRELIPNSTWRCGGCWARKPRSRPARWRGSRSSGRASSRPGGNVP